MGGLCGALLPSLLTVCLDTFGYKHTLIGWAVVVLVLISMCLLCIHPRTPYPVAPKLTLSDVGFVRKQLFWVLPTATISQGLAQGCLVAQLAEPSDRHWIATAGNACVRIHAAAIGVRHR